jgi:hypothetical protein
VREGDAGPQGGAAAPHATQQAGSFSSHDRSYVASLPVATHELAHGSIAFNTGDQLVFFFGHHGLGL